MLSSLPYDLLNKIMTFLEPKEIKVLYDASKDLIKEMMEETNFIVECKVIIPDEQVKWFETNNIKINLLEEYNINLFGDQMWYKNGKRHRDNDLPAIIISDGHKYWYQNDVSQRENDLPAVIFSNGSKFWKKNGLLHRDNDLPAEMHSNGDQVWYRNGKLHRDNDMPAVICSNGDQAWYQNGKLHRENEMPAVIRSNGVQEWYQNGKRYKDENSAAVIVNGEQDLYKNGIKNGLMILSKMVVFMILGKMLLSKVVSSILNI